jgi:hypothetical protein
VKIFLMKGFSAFAIVAVSAQAHKPVITADLRTEKAVAIVVKEF